MMTKEECKVQSKKMGAMLPPGWKEEITSNLGWHVSYTKGNITVSFSESLAREKPYHALIADAGQCGYGMAFLSSSSCLTAATPAEAIRLELKRMEEKAAELKKSFDDALSEANQAAQGCLFRWIDCELYDTENNYLGEVDPVGWVPSKDLLKQSPERQKEVHDFVHRIPK